LKLLLLMIQQKLISSRKQKQQKHNLYPASLSPSFLVVVNSLSAPIILKIEFIILPPHLMFT